MSVKTDSLGQKTTPDEDTDGKFQISNSNQHDLTQNTAANDATAEIDDSSDLPVAVHKSASAELDLRKNDAYFYTKREEFTSELFKIELKNLPKYGGFKELRKMANKAGTFPKKIKFGPGGSFAFMSFGSESERQDAITKLNGFKFKGKELEVKQARPKADPFILKRKLKESQLQGQSEKQPRIDNETSTDTAPLDPSELVLNSVTPLWKVSYEEQLKKKENAMRNILATVTKLLGPLCSAPWVKEKSSELGGLCCCFNPIKPSPTTEHYRNKVEFNIANGPSGDAVVGFRTGNYKGGNFGLMEPTRCINVTKEAKEIAKAFQQFVQKSQYPPYDPMLHTGYWRQLTVRTCRNSEVMIIAQSHPQQLNEVEIEDMKKSLYDLFMGEDTLVKVKSLYLQLLGQRQSTEDTLHSYRHVGGEKTISEEMFGMKFRISPDAFFQVNTSATEVLYSVVKDLSLVGESTTVLDICCGTGTIALTLAKNGAKKVVGFELSQQAVEDAKYNAIANDLNNVEFIQGKAEDTLYSVLKCLPDDANIVAIVDPPRAGLHGKVIQAIRRCSQIRTLVYVSCNPKLAINNFVDLCRDQTRRNKGSPFQLQQAVPVDLFPHTEYCELVLLLTRYEASSGPTSV